MKTTVATIIGIVLYVTAASAFGQAGNTPQSLTPLQYLGRFLYYDPGLSDPPGQACAACHAAGAGFADPHVELPVSRGAITNRFGSRNSPSAAYAAYSPVFHYDSNMGGMGGMMNMGMYVGGLFWDGRASNLAHQAKGPFLNPLEMHNASKQALVAKVAASRYADLFRWIFGADAFNDPEKAYEQIAAAIAEYESSGEVSKFSSKYDLYLAGRASLTPEEARGLTLFGMRAKCFACHPLSSSATQPPLFTHFGYVNLGVPRNPANPYYNLPPELNPDGTNYLDRGLGAILQDPAENGKFKVPTLRNVAVTPPYAHNGVFTSLYEIVNFYNTRDLGGWPAPEVPENVFRQMRVGRLGLSTQDVNDLVAFLNTLTDGYVDADGDHAGWPNGDPTPVVVCGRVNEDLNLWVLGETNRNYTVQTRDDLLTGEWQPWTTLAGPGSVPIMVGGASDPAARFYRVQQTSP
jgi:cytochrome c peroxidase